MICKRILAEIQCRGRDRDLREKDEFCVCCWVGFTVFAMLVAFSSHFLGRRRTYTVLVEVISVVVFSSRVWVDVVSFTINVLIAYDVAVTVLVLEVAVVVTTSAPRLPKIPRPRRPMTWATGTAPGTVETVGFLELEVVLIEVVLVVVVVVLVLGTIVHGVDNVEMTVERECVYDVSVRLILWVTVE
jgi:hypothetical protein